MALFKIDYNIALLVVFFSFVFATVVRQLSVENITTSTANITWLPPDDGQLLDCYHIEVTGGESPFEELVNITSIDNISFIYELHSLLLDTR